jgi:hypothetical protein
MELVKAAIDRAALRLLYGLQQNASQTHASQAEHAREA